MLKVIIADDERRVRNIVIKKGRWEELGLCVAGEAKNGKELVELAQKLLPDIILTDMKMPGLHGAELMKVLSGQFPGTKVIVISGYDDFGYMKQAIASKATDYILKPISEEELNDSLRKAVHEIHEVRKNESAMFKAKKSEPLVLESVFQKYMKGADLTGEIIRYMGMEERSDIECRVSVVKLINFTKICEAEFEGDEYILMSAVINIIDELIQGMGRTVNIQDQNAVAVLHVDRISDENIMALMSGVMEALKKYLQLEAVSGIGEVYQCAEDIRKSCEEAWSAVWNQNLKKKNKPAFYHDVKAGQEINILKGQTLNQLEASLKSGNEKTIHQALKCVYEVLDRNVAYNLKMLEEINSKVIRIMEMTVQKENDLGARLIEDLETRVAAEYLPESIIEQFMETVHQVLKEQIIPENEKVLYSIQKYIEENYTSKITLDDISKKFWISKQHLLKLYKQQFGITPYVRIMDLKIEKAKLLLIENRMKVVEIAELLNFTDESHFSRNFKKYTGVSPREFKNQYKKK